MVNGVTGREGSGGVDEGRGRVVEGWLREGRVVEGWMREGGGWWRGDRMERLKGN